MKFIIKKPGKGTKKTIKNFSKLARTLMEFELLWYLSCYGIVEQAKSGLQATAFDVDGTRARET